MAAIERLAREVARTLTDAGFIAYFAGGCVRDRLMGREPDDFDIATDATADRVQELFPQTIPVGAQFGVVLVRHEGQTFEVATFRADAEYLDGRRPTSVRFTSPEQDAQRRDFTINGMFLDPATDELIDYVGGRDDLKRGVIRAIGSAEERIAEDRLRMLRAVRFAARFGFEIAPDTRNALRLAAPRIVDMAWERIGDEIVKILREGPPGSARRAFELLDETGLLDAVLPEVAAMKGVEQSPDYHPEGDVFVHTLGLLERLDKPTEMLALGALLHDVAKPRTAGRKGDRITFYGHCELGAEMAVEICKRLKRSRETWDGVAYLVKNHLKPMNARDMRKSTLKRFLRDDGIDELLALVRLDALAGSGDLTDYEFCRAALEDLGEEQLKPKPLLTGRDLIDLGLEPGPRFKEILSSLEEAQLEGTMTSREEALAWVRRQAASPTDDPQE